MEIKSLARTGFDIILQAYEQAFADYEVQQDKEQLRRMLKRRGFDPNLSFAAFEDSSIVAFTLNGIGYYNGAPTAYDTGTGTLEHYRGKGLATSIFEYSVPYLREANIKQYLLEVLQHNAKAISVYRNLGFETTRELNYFMQEKDKINNCVGNSGSLYSVKPIGIDEYNSISASFSDFKPSWQNSPEAVKRASEDFVSMGAFNGNELIGYCIFEPVSGDVTQIAVDKKFRNKGVGSLLFNEVMSLNKSNLVKIINTDASDHAVTAFLKSKNIPVKGKQFEMIKTI